jgi:hypothetical protein
VFRQNRESIGEAGGLNLINHHFLFRQPVAFLFKSIVTREKDPAKHPAEWRRSLTRVWPMAKNYFIQTGGSLPCPGGLEPELRFREPLRHLNEAN